MLSPAPHRLCCLAVMAPALTKAARQADCLPVVLSKVCCVRGTSNNFLNRHISEVSNDAKLRSVNTSMPDDGTWCQPALRCDLLLKSPNLVSQVSPVILLSPRDQTNAELKAKSWHGTKFAAAISAKIRLKTTMNRNSSPTVKNMGLAKANTSLSFQSPKKIQRIMPVSHTGALTPKTQRILQLPEKPLDILGSTVSGNYISSSPSFATTIIENAVMPMSKFDGIGPVSSPPVAATASTMVNETPSSSSQTGVTRDSADVSMSLSTIVALPTILSNADSAIPNSTSDMINERDSFLSSSENSESTLSANASPSSGTFSDIQNDMLLDDISLSPTVPHAIELTPSVSRLSSTQPTPNLQSSSPPRKILMRYRKESKDIISSIASNSPSKIGVIKSSKLHAESLHHSSASQRKLEMLKSQHAQADQKCTELRSHTYEHQLRHLNHYIKQQLRGFVEHYQRRLNIPCQKQARFNLSRNGKDSVDLKAELLQSENVRSLSTAALVNLVRKMESSPEKYLSQQTYSSQSSVLSTSDKIIVQVEPVEWEDVRRVSNCLASDVRRLLSSADPDVTDISSEEESCDESEVSVEELSTGPQIHKRALWKWANERATIASRWTWLVAQVHDLEYHLRRLGEVAKQLRIAKGAVCFEESEDPSALSTQDNSNLHASPAKALKSIIKPMNGYLGHGTTSSSADNLSSAQTANPSPEAIDQLDSGQAEAGYACRTRPLKVSVFRKRKLLPIEGLHLSSSKASRLSTVGCSCNCQSVMLPCVLCSGRYNNVQSVDPDSMPLLERIALLDPSFHPVLSFVKDVPLQLHFENALKKKEAYYQSLNINSQVIKKPRLGMKPKKFSDIRHYNRKLKCYPGSLLSAKYMKKHVRNSSGHYRKRGLVFGKWKKFKRPLRRMRRYSIASSNSSQDSPVHSPSSLFDDSYGYDQFKRRRDDFQFDIDDVIIPCNSKAGRYEKIQYKDIEIPSWRYMDLDETEPANEDEKEVEDISDIAFAKRNLKLEIEEKKIIRAAALDFTRMATGRRGRRAHRCDSRADSSGANTPDPVLLYQQDIVFQDPNTSGGPISPALSPPATPGSAILMSDDSQPAFGINERGMAPRPERKQVVTLIRKDRTYEDSISEHIEVSPYEPREFPLADREFEEMLKESTHFNDEPDLNLTSLVCPTSPMASSESTSTVEEEEDDDITDPEWKVVKRDISGPEQTLVLKLAKR